MQSLCKNLMPNNECVYKNFISCNIILYIYKPISALSWEGIARGQGRNLCIIFAAAQFKNLLLKAFKIFFIVELLKIV